jgi:MFS family permease
MERLLGKEGDQENQAPEASKGVYDYQVYSFRWVILLTFILAGTANAFVLLTWSPITDKAQIFWNDIDITAINLLSVIFQICYIPGTFIALYLTSNYGLRASLVSGSTLTALGCFIRYIGVLIRDSTDATTSYGVVFLGTVLVALAQPVYLNMPAKIASIWFSTSERDTAAVFGSLSNPLGSAIGSVLPGALVTGDSFSSIKHGIQNTVLVQMIVGIFSWFVVFFAFRERPPTPPSATAEEVDRSRQDDSGSQNLVESFGDLFSNAEYLKLLFSFTIILANLNAVATLLNQLPTNYSGGEIGLTGAALIIGGFLASIFMGYLLDYTKAYQLILKIAYIATALSWVFFMSCSRNDIYPLFITAAVFLGGTTLPAGK